MHELKYHVQRIMDAHRRDEETVEAVYIDIIKASEEDVIQVLPPCRPLDLSNIWRRTSGCKTTRCRRRCWPCPR